MSDRWRTSQLARRVSRVMVPLLNGLWLLVLFNMLLYLGPCCGTSIATVNRFTLCAPELAGALAAGVSGVMESGRFLLLTAGGLASRRSR